MGMNEDDQDETQESSSDARAELESYLAEVVAELRRREQKLAALDREISTLEHSLQQSSLGRALAEGNTAKIVAAESHRSSVRSELRKKKLDRVEVFEDVERARERKRLAEEDLEALEEKGEASAR